MIFSLEIMVRIVNSASGNSKAFPTTFIHKLMVVSYILATAAPYQTVRTDVAMESAQQI